MLPLVIYPSSPQTVFDLSNNCWGALWVQRIHHPTLFVSFFADQRVKRFPGTLVAFEYFCQDKFRIWETTEENIPRLNSSKILPYVRNSKVDANEQEGKPLLPTRKRNILFSLNLENRETNIEASTRPRSTEG